MTTLSIVLGAISLALFIAGILIYGATVSGYNRHKFYGAELIATIIGAIGFFLCLVL